MGLPLVLRFPWQPLLCLLCQAIMNCLLGPHPTYGDIALWLVSCMLLLENITTAALKPLM